MVFLKEHRTTIQYYHDELHYAGLFAPHIMALKDGGFLASLLYLPKDFQCITEDEIIYSIRQIQNALDMLEKNWTIQFDLHRSPITVNRKNIFSNPLARAFEEEKKKTAHSYYGITFFINIYWRIPHKYSNWINTLFYKKYDEMQSDKDNLLFFSKKIEEFHQIISSAFLFSYFLKDSDFLSYLHSCTSLKYHKLLMPNIPFYIDSILDDVEISTEYPIQIDDTYVNVIHINDYPAFTHINMLKSLEHLPFAFRYSSRFIALGREDAIKELNKYRARFFSKRKGMLQTLQEQQGTVTLDNTEELARVGQIDDALERVGKDEFSFGFLTSKIIIYDKDFIALKQKTDYICQAIASEGFSSKQETFNAFDAFLGTHPGNVYSDIRRPLMQTKSLSHMILACYPWQGEKENIHFKKEFNSGDYHMLCTTEGNNIFYFNLNVQDVGHTFIAGPTGSGKSTLLCSMAIQFFRYDNAKVIIFDKDKSAYKLVQGLQGIQYVPGEKDSPFSFQPLRYIHTQEGFLFACDFIKTILELKNIHINLSIEKEISKTLELLKTFTPNDRTITNYTMLLQDEHSDTPLQSTLLFYSSKGPWGFLFDGNTENINTAKLCLFEMSEIMKYKPDVIIPSLLYLFYIIEKNIGSHPTLMIIDEAWLFLQNSIFAHRIESWLKTLRKKHVYVVFATQELADVTNSKIVDSIIGNCKTKIFLPNPAAQSNQELYLRFGLVEKDIHVISNARQKCDYFYCSELGKRLFSLALTEKQLEIIKEGT